jgi:hypothetical protein
MYYGFDYDGQVENFTLSSAAQDIFQIQAAATVPFCLEHIVVTAGTTAQNILRVQMVFRSTASTVQTATGTFKGKSENAPAAQATLLAGCTTVGTPGNLGGAQEWNVTAPLEYNWIPRALIIPAAGFLSLYSPAAFGTTLPLSIWIEGFEVR